MEWRGKIVCDPHFLGGKPTVKGTRISVELILESLGAGIPEADILAAYPTLPKDAVRASLAYVTNLMANHAKDTLEVA